MPIEFVAARLGSGHCCVCAGICHHIGPARFCDEHRPPTYALVPAGHYCPTCGVWH